MVGKNSGANLQILGTIILLLGNAFAYMISHAFVCNLSCSLSNTSCCAMRGAFLTTDVKITLAISVIALFFALLTRFWNMRSHQLATATTMFSIISFLSLLLVGISYASIFPLMQVFTSNDIMALIIAIVGMFITMEGSILVMRYVYTQKSAAPSRRATTSKSSKANGRKTKRAKRSRR